MDTLRSVTRSLPGPIRNTGLSLIGPDCYKSLVLDINLTDSKCMKLALSKTLGLFTVAGAAFVKVPQIMKILNSQSASGVSFLAYVFETAGMICTLAYNARSGFPFSTYGETALIAAQNVVICLLVLRFTGQTTLAAGFLGGLVAVIWGLFSGLDMSMLAYAQVAAGLFGVASKAPQIWTIYKQQGTGQLSAFAVFMQCIGTLMRIFTTIQEVKDPLILSSFIAAFSLNAIIGSQMIYYWKSSTTAPHGAEAGDKAEKLANGSSTGLSNGKASTTRRRG